MSLQPGQKVAYTDAEGKDQTGVIHGVKKAEATDGTDIILGYLVDTGNDVSVEEFKRNKFDDFVNERANKIVADPKNPIDDFGQAVAKVLDSDKLPKSEPYTEKIRQPEQVEVLPENIRAVK